jgi:hypothetical protein
MPPRAVYVGRGSVLGNPFPVDGDAVTLLLTARARDPKDPVDRQRAAVELYTRWIARTLSELPDDVRAALPRPIPTPPTVEQIRIMLRGKDVACWCGLDEPCHGDPLLDIANPERLG